MAKNLVLAGGGHAHMMILANISKIIASGHNVTVIQPSEYHYYSGMGPGMLSGYYTADDIRFQTKLVVEKQGGRFILDKVSTIEATANRLLLESGMSVEYDVLSCNTGSYIPSDKLGNTCSTIFTAKPIERLLEAKQKIVTLGKTQDSITIAVVGGGPAAIEIAGCAHQLARDAGFKTTSLNLFSGPNLLKEYPQAVAAHLRKSYAKRHITIAESSYVTTMKDNKLILEDGIESNFDIAFVATGVKPSKIFKNSGLPTGPDGGLCVNARLQCIQHPNILGGGDCIHFSPQTLNKVGVYAVRQNPVLLQNVCALLSGDKPVAFNPGGGYLLIFNMGDMTGILHKAGLTWSGKSSFFIKNYIDKKFMKKFKDIEKGF